MEHVYEKIINLDNESQTTSSTANDKPGEQEKEEDMAMLAEEKIELMCQDQVSTNRPYHYILAECPYRGCILQRMWFTWPVKEAVLVGHADGLVGSTGDFHDRHHQLVQPLLLLPRDRAEVRQHENVLMPLGFLTPWLCG